MGQAVTLTYGSMCSGIEAATVAWHGLGWKAAYYSEIEPFACAVLAHHYPSIPNYGDMTQYAAWPVQAGAVDLLVAGTPCQSFSTAGLRKGLDDPRGSLMLTFLAVVERQRPRWLVWENVPGVLSSGRGRDFGAFLGALGYLGYGWAYRVLDASRVGGCALHGDPYGRGPVPQRRRRVFVVACAGDQRSAAKVLFERESLSWDREARGKSRKGSAYASHAGPDGSHRFVPDQVGAVMRTTHHDGMCATDGNQYVGVCKPHAFDSTGGSTGLNAEPDISPTIKVGSGLDIASPPAVAIPRRPVGTDCFNGSITGDLAATMGTPGSSVNSSGPTVMVPAPQGFDMYNQILTGDLHKTLQTATGAGSPAVLVSAHGNVVPTLTSNYARHGDQPNPNGPNVIIEDKRDAMVFEPRHYARDGTGGKPDYMCPTIRASSSKGGDGAPHVVINDDPKALMFRPRYYTADDAARSSGGPSEVASTLNASRNMSSDFSPCVAYDPNAVSTPGSMQVRRLTPEECEALQGFPRGYTAIPYRGKPASAAPDTGRYKALGNSMAVNVMRWIGERIDRVHRGLSAGG